MLRSLESVLSDYLVHTLHTFSIPLPLSLLIPLYSDRMELMNSVQDLKLDNKRLQERNDQIQLQVSQQLTRSLSLTNCRILCSQSFTATHLWIA